MILKNYLAYKYTTCNLHIIIPCRLDLSEDGVREKERYEAREREEVVRKQRERKAADIKARQDVIRQIAEDRK